MTHLFALVLCSPYKKVFEDVRIGLNDLYRFFVRLEIAVTLIRFAWDHFKVLSIPETHEAVF